MPFDNVFINKKVLITGNTGFKGSWLTIWLQQLGANIVGLADCVPTEPSHFAVCNLEKTITQYWVDIRDLETLSHVLRQEKPDFIFHLAAQALVQMSYDNPIQTLGVNSVGTMNILEALRCLDKHVAVVMVTSDKVYRNMEWKWGYRESDQLGGKDPYSASKGMAELVIDTYVESFFKDDHSNVSIGIARAGNVIGGGDWAANRIVPDSIKSWCLQEEVSIRNPQATRPWQHVLEPLSGYLVLASELNKSRKFHGQAYNFGPIANQNYRVSELIAEMSKYLEQFSFSDASQSTDIMWEAGLLKLNCDKALIDLIWEPTLGFEDTVRLTVEWYKDFYSKNFENILNTSISQVEYYQKSANEQGKKWAS